ncbi:MAG: TIGR04283 family arsenosugar biosynthesis glycosyltransferase [Gammaproteobacteria bacterium]|nr:TIGR04283 family arsenosugar biosynthesis glycosyltransferase [Gammaproteobacteria bacterium]MDH5777144.1 TIGR04283 family arsenosugar biosynthesis glycosyltransferase [Gammaproteobacteria bacterium]
MKLSFIIPVLNEASNIQKILLPLLYYREQGHEVILVDGGSTDNTIDRAENMVDKVIRTQKGRSTQMNAGAQKANGDVFVFLHADTWLPDQAAEIITHAMNKSPKVWGRFDIKFTGSHWIYRIISTMMNFRSALSGIATGDQCIFVQQSVFEKIGGYADIPLMEDVNISKQLKAFSRPVRVKFPAVTSSRRWEQNGVLRTILLMWYLRASYFFGVSASKLVGKYYRQAG